MKLDPKNAEVKNLLTDLNRKTTGIKPGPKKASPTSQIFPGIRTMFPSSRSNPFAPTVYDDDYDDDITKKPEIKEVFPRPIQPLVKPVERRSKV